jgi:SAM-dependent methyltransferase
VSSVQHAVALSAEVSDFMRRDYELVTEPLNLATVGLPWFGAVYHKHVPSGNLGLVLGATPWACRFVGGTHRRVIAADMSGAMAAMLRADVARTPFAVARSVEVLQVNWLELPDLSEPLDLVVGDNSFSFLRFPDGWQRLCSVLAERMRRGARLVVRVCSTPARHKRVGVDALIARFSAQRSINCTEVRAALLFDHWDRATYAIDTEQALRTFESNRGKFEQMLQVHQVPARNDLMTIVKYRDAQATYYAPPLGEVLDAIGTSFKVISVNIGPFSMGEYFPLIVATK